MIKTAVHLTFSISCILVFDTRNIGATVFVTFIIFLAPCAPYSKQRDCYLSTHTTIYIKYLSHHTQYPPYHPSSRFCLLLVVFVSSFKTHPINLSSQPK